MQETTDTPEEKETVDEKTTHTYVEYCRDGFKPTSEKIETGKLN